ncbi:hypothetical protein [Porphyromonas macacae]|uniref:hypothetical protein n=1 Tax=Porphyromonas macacae TaxID=28115 RepID=UPI0024AD464C|nr:hypothetical protein [Porphyromonas macacae]
MRTKNNKVKYYLYTHPLIVNVLATGFLLLAIYANFTAVSDAFENLQDLECKTGVIEHWYRTGGRYNEADLKIFGDSIRYTTERFGGWICLQHSGKVGEKVMFYTLKTEAVVSAEKLPYFGLSKKDNPRHRFWIFFEVLLHSFRSVLVFWFIGFFGIPLFNLEFVKNRGLLLASWCIFAISVLLFGLAVIS